MSRRAGLATFVMIAVGAISPQVRAQSTDSTIATPIEQALIEQACSTPPVVAINPDKHDECLHGKLNVLRADFGRDLSRLSSADRRKIDAVCDPIRGAEGREGYISCVTTQLAAVQARWNRGRSDVVATASAVVPAPVQPAAMTTTPAVVVTQASSRIWLVVTLALATLGVASVGLVVANKKVRPQAPRVCRACGTGVEGAGDLCVPCRHEAAEALRRAASERAERARSADDPDPQQGERDEDDRHRQALEAEDAQRQHQELARQAEEAAPQAEEEALRRKAEEAEAQRQAICTEEDAVFDPYRVLDIPPDANADVIQAAHTRAKAKYDAREVEDMGDQIKLHYRQKAEAADRAFQMLTGAHELPPATPSHVFPSIG